MPSGVSVVVLALGAGWMYVRRRLAAQGAERALAGVHAALVGSRRELDEHGRDSVRFVLRDVPVRVHAGPPHGDDPAWMTGLGAVARYVTDGGPRFRAGSDSAEEHLRTAGPLLPLRAHYGRSIGVTGEHQEARGLIARAFEAIEPTGLMPAPYLKSDGREVSAWIARIPPEEHLPDVTRRLARLVAELARWRSDVLDEYATAIGAAVVIEADAPPPALRARLELGREAGTIVVDARFVREPERLVGTHTFAVRASGPTALAIPRERVPLDRLHAEAARRVPASVIERARRALIRSEPGRAILEWAVPPTPGELAAAVDLLTAISPARASRGPFR